MNRINRKYWYIITQIFYKKKFKFIGKNSVVYKPLQIDEPCSVIIENDVYIAQNSWIMGNKTKEQTLMIGRNSTIGHYAHIIAKEKVVIEKKVLIADKVFISDCTHNYEDINRPVIQQGISIVKPVCIGEGSWIGENVCICGVNIGKHCVIGANSVVTRDIPDYSIAAGVPAKIIKKYNFDNKKWEKFYLEE